MRFISPKLYDGAFRGQIQSAIIRFMTKDVRNCTGKQIRIVKSKSDEIISSGQKDYGKLEKVHRINFKCRNNLQKDTRINQNKYMTRKHD